jgi:hypothetical protein
VIYKKLNTRKPVSCFCVIKNASVYDSQLKAHRITTTQLGKHACSSGTNMYVICMEGGEIIDIHVTAKLISNLQKKASITSRRVKALALVNIYIKYWKPQQCPRIVQTH